MTNAPAWWQMPGCPDLMGPAAAAEACCIPAEANAAAAGCDETSMPKPRRTPLPVDDLAILEGPEGCHERDTMSGADGLISLCDGEDLIVLRPVQSSVEAIVAFALQ